MPGPVPGISRFCTNGKKDVDGRDKPGHDEVVASSSLRAQRSNPFNGRTDAWIASLRSQWRWEFSVQASRDIRSAQSRFPSHVAKFLHHFRWRDIYHFHRGPVYQHFWCDPRKSHDLLRVTRRPRRL